MKVVNQVTWTALALLLITLLLVGCAGTVAPIEVRSNQIGYDATEADSQLLTMVPGGYIISPSGRDTYNALIKVYGNDPLFLPPLKMDAGIKPVGANFFIDNEHIVDCGQMQIWRRSQTHSPKSPLQKAITL